MVPIDQSLWQDMFPCLVGKANTVEVLFRSVGGTRDGELQLVCAAAVIVFPPGSVVLEPKRYAISL